jgi:hypothetical protein
MKKLLVGAAAAAALIAPGVASADTQGAIDFNYETTDYDTGSDFDQWSLGGGFATDFSHGLRVQLDGRTTQQEWNGGGGDYSHGYAAAHVSGDLAGFNVGGFAGFLNYYGDGATLLGVEARRGFGNISLNGSIGHADFGDDNGYDGTSYRLGGSYFFMPNFAVSAGYGLTNIDDSFQDSDITEWNVGAAYQFSNNIELYGAYVDSENDRSISGDYEFEAFQVGMRLNFNGGTLQDNANGGLWGAARDISETYSRW